MISLALSILLVLQPAATQFFDQFGGGGGGSVFDMFDFGEAQRTPACHWDVNRIPEAMPLNGYKDVCYDLKPPYIQSQVQLALKNDRRAQFFYDNLIQMYQPMNQTYFSEHFQYGGNAFRFRDMCVVNPVMVHRVNAPLLNGGGTEVCNVVNPYQQNIYMAECENNCMFDRTTQADHFCVPDGYIRRLALVFCPSSFKQCRPVHIKIPVGCSCKKYTCLKYAK